MFNKLFSVFLMVSFLFVADVKGTEGNDIFQPITQETHCGTYPIPCESEVKREDITVETIEANETTD